MKAPLTPALKRLWHIFPKPLLILGLGALAVFALLNLKPAPRTLPPREPEPQEVAVVYAEPQSLALTVSSQGTVEPRHEINLVARVSGQVVEISEHFVNGGFFSANEPLLKIDPRDYELAVTRARARVAEARQLLATEKGRVRQAQREWRDLGNEEANALFLRKPQLAAVEAQLESAKADLQQAQLDLERTVITAPFDGRVREANADIGQYIAAGSQLGRVYDTSVAEIRLPLTDNQAALVDLPLGFRSSNDAPAPQVTIHGVVAGERQQWQGRIVRTDASLDVNTRFYYAVAEVKDPFVQADDQSGTPLVVGLFVNAEISGRPLANVIHLPRQALFKNDQIYVVTADNKIENKTVRVLKTDQENAWVQGDLAKDEKIVVGDQSFLTPGMTVAPQPVKEVVTGTRKPTIITD